MADHPLLPQARLRELHALMQRCRMLDRKRKAGEPLREGWLAATALQLEPGDLLCPEPGDTVEASLHPSPASESGAGAGNRAGNEYGNRSGTGSREHTSLEIPSSLRLSFCAGMARGLQAAGARRVVLAYGRAGTAEPFWADALSWAQRDRLPLLVACADVARAGRKRQGEVLSSEGVTSLAQETGLPVFPVDAEDPVAVYRVMYEAVLRAREGGGPAVLWGFFSKRSGSTTPRTAQPLPRLEKYLKARAISFKP